MLLTPCLRLAGAAAASAVPAARLLAAASPTSSLALQVATSRPSPLTPVASVCAANLVLPNVTQRRPFNFRRKDQRIWYNIKKDPPVGPHKQLAPGHKVQGWVGQKDIDYHKIIHWPEDGKYTIKPLKMTKLAGRHPVTGHKVVNGLGGGYKRRYRWIDWLRLPPEWDRDGPDYEERVIEVRYDPNRKAQIALTAHKDHMRWQIATSNMKPGDLICSNGRIPKTPVKPVEGNSYPLGALPVGTSVCLVEFLPGDFKRVMYYRAEDTVKIVRKEGDRVIIEDNLRAGHMFSLDQRGQCVVGTVSIHPLKKAHIGTPNRLRWLGFAPRSGFWQRKTGDRGRKIKKPPPVQVIEPEEPKNYTELLLTHHDHGRRGRKRGKKRKHNAAGW